jgi:hypothetical protein
VYALVTAGLRKKELPGRLARLSGRLIGFVSTDKLCIWIAGPTGDVTPAAWPSGYRGRLRPLELLNEDGDVVAAGGAEVTVSGGFLPAGEALPMGVPRVFVVSSLRRVVPP